MNLYNLIFQQQNRYKFWNWDEVFAYTKLTPSEVKAIVDNKKYELNDPLSTLVFSHKNHDKLALDNIFDNYCNPNNFGLSYNDYGLSINFILHFQSPNWQNYNSNTDWYWKQKWFYKYGQWLKVFPGVKDILLSCSAALENSHDGSDIDLMIEVQHNFVWITKPYFAILSKVLKYYNLNFPLAAFYFITNQISKLAYLKNRCVKNKIKIDFGLVFESQSQLKQYYSNKERNIFVWSALQTNNQAVAKQIFGLTIFQVIKVLILPTIIFIYPIGILNYLYEQKYKNNYNKLVLWNIYSQYNLVY